MPALDPHGQPLPQQPSYQDPLAIPTAGTPLASPAPQQTQNVPAAPAPPTAAPQPPAPAPAPTPAAPPAAPPAAAPPVQYPVYQGQGYTENYYSYHPQGPNRTWNWGTGGDSAFMQALFDRLSDETDEERQRRLGGVFFTPRTLSALSGGSASFTGTPGSTSGGSSTGGGSTGYGGWGGFLGGLLGRLGG